MSFKYEAAGFTFGLNTLKMIMQIRKNKVIGDVQNDFSSSYPFLKLEFYRTTSGRPGSAMKQKLIKTVLLGMAGNQKEGDIEITDGMTVGQLEKSLYEKFGMTVQVCRKSGTIWLETTMTDNWTLNQQNEHGRELSEPVAKIRPDREMDADQ